MKTILVLLLCLSTQAFASECKGILYSDSVPADANRCVKLSKKKYCCEEGGLEGEYRNGSYHYRIPGNAYRDSQPRPKRCYFITHCEGGGYDRGPYCGPQKVCEY